MQVRRVAAADRRVLRAVHVGWREKNLTDSASELFELGRDLHRRAAIVLEHAAKVGGSIDTARRSYNEFVGSVQGRLIPALRRFEERDARSSKELMELQDVEGEVRAVEGLLPLEHADPDSKSAGNGLQEQDDLIQPSPKARRAP